MILIINGKEYPLRFGFAAIDYLDKIYYLEEAGVKLGQGIPLLVSNLVSENPLALFHAYRAGMITEKSQPSNAELEVYLEGLAEEDKLDELFKEVIDELKKSALTKKKTLAMVGAMGMEEPVKKPVRKTAAKA